MLNLRGHFLPVLDEWTLAGADAPLPLIDQVSILGVASAQLGLIVDQAQTVRPVSIARTTTSPRSAARPIISDALHDATRAA